MALARALARRPRLMLLDEPFSALDTGLREQIRRATADILADAGIATVLVTHDREEAMSFADQLVVLREGRLVQAGRPRDLYLSPVDGATAHSSAPPSSSMPRSATASRIASLALSPWRMRSDLHCRAVPALCCGPSSCACRRVADPRMAGFWQQSSSLAQPRASQ